jgi:hypothetical protein
MGPMTKAINDAVMWTAMTGVICIKILFSTKLTTVFVGASSEAFYINFMNTSINRL